MSWSALTWAKSIRVGSSSEKQVLMALAYRHNEDLDLCYPSISSIVEFTELDRKTVISCLSRLAAKGLIADTGERMGKTKQIVVYKLLGMEASQKRNCSDFSGETVPKLGHGKTIGKKSPSGAKAPSVDRARGKRNFEAAFLDDEAVQRFAVLCVQWAAKELRWSTGDARAEFNRFKDSNIANGRKYIDWLAAWRNWCRSDFCSTAKRYETDTSYRKGPIRG